jgi:hypothetical protein
MGDKYRKELTVAEKILAADCRRPESPEDMAKKQRCGDPARRATVWEEQTKEKRQKNQGGLGILYT